MLLWALVLLAYSNSFHGEMLFVPRRRRHVCMGDVSGELQVLTRRIRAGVVVMGAVSRSALKRFFIGNAAERVLDRLDCDVLVVKPRGFKSQVTPRPRMAPIRARRASGTAATRRSRISSAADAMAPLM